MTASPGDDAAARLQRSWQANARAGRAQCTSSASRAAAQARMPPSSKRCSPAARAASSTWAAARAGSRALAARGLEVIGIDASVALVDAARALGGARFECASYADLAADPVAYGTFDAVACNFALLDADLDSPLRAARACLQSRGHLFVQTLHPFAVEPPYADGWRVEHFAGLDGFSEAMPWYFRALSGWFDALHAGGFAVDGVGEPVDPASGRLLSLLLRASLQQLRAAQ
jgi:hypothetical protein